MDRFKLIYDILRLDVNLVKLVYNYDYFISNKLKYIINPDRLTTIDAIPNGTIIGGNRNGEIMVWKNGQFQFSMKIGSYDIGIICPLSNILVAVVSSGILRVVNLEDQSIKILNQIKGITYLRKFYDNKVICKSTALKIYIWNPLTDEIEVTLNEPDYITGIAGISKDHIIVGHIFSPSKIWNLKTQKVEREIGTNSRGLTVLRNGDIAILDPNIGIIIVDKDPYLRIKDYGKNEVLPLPNGTVLFTDIDRVMVIWNPETNKSKSVDIKDRASKLVVNNREIILLSEDRLRIEVYE